MNRSAAILRALPVLLALLVLLSLATPIVGLAASPTPGPAAGDPRSAGEGPGFVGAPGLAILGVLVIGAASAVLTLLYVRTTARRESASRGEGASRR